FLDRPLPRCVLPSFPTRRSSDLAGISATRVRKVIMVCRTYPIRVQNPSKGTSGFMVSEISWEEIAKRSGYSVSQLKEAEKTTTRSEEQTSELQSRFDLVCRLLLE